MKMTIPDGDSVDFDVVYSRAGTGSTKWDRYAGRDVLPFWVADMDFPIAPPILRALQARVAHPFFGYTGAPKELSEAIVAHLEHEYDWSIDPDWLVYLPGVVPGLAAGCRSVCGYGDEIITNPPIYHEFLAAHDARRQRLVDVPLKRDNARWTYDLDAMREAFNERTRVLTLCVPHNPTARVYSPEELRAVTALAMQYDTLIVSDEIHADLVLDNSVRHVPTAKACPDWSHRIITLMSPSKTWNLAGLNCSYAIISDPGLRNTFRRGCRAIVPSVPPLAYTASLAAYREASVWRHDLLAYLAGNHARLQKAIDAMPGLSLEPLEATYLAWIDARELGLEHVQRWFEDCGVGLSAGEQFGLAGYVRLNFACPRSTLDAGLERMGNAIAEHKVRACTLSPVTGSNRRPAP